MSLFDGFRRARTSLTAHGDDAQSIMHPLNDHLDNSLAWINNDSNFQEVERYPTPGTVEHYTRNVGNYIVTTLKHVGNRTISSDVRKAASIYSSVPNQSIQGYRDDENTFYHVMTRLDASGSGTGTYKEAAAVHALNTYIVASSMRSSHVASAVSNGKLRDKNQFNEVRQGLPIEDRGLFHYAQYTGSIDVSSGQTSGEEFYIIRNDPRRSEASALQRRWRDAVSVLKDVFGLSYHSDRPLHNYAERVRRSSVNMYRTLLNFDGTEARVDGNPVSTQSVRPQFISRPLDQDTANRVINEFYGPSQQPVQLVENLQTMNLSTFANAHSPSIPPPAPYDATVQGTVTAGPVPPRPASHTFTSEPQAAPSPQATPSTPSPEAYEPATEQPAQPAHPAPSFGEFGFSFPSDWGSHRDAYLARSPVSGEVAGTSRNFEPVEVDRNLIQVISPEAFKNLETRFAIGGIEHGMSEPILQATERSVQALTKLRGLMSGFGVASDADEHFYRRTGAFALPSNSFEVRKFNDYSRLDAFLKKRMQLAGAFVGTDPDGYDVWLLDHPGQMAQHVSSIMGGGEPSGFTSPSFNLSNSPTPDMNMDPHTWEITNVPGMSMREASGHGFVIPIKGNQAVFVPSFANPDFTFGMEFETGIHEQVHDIVHGVERHFGYDLNKFGFHGSFDSVHDPSIYGGGREYLTPVMSGLRAFKAAYLFGEGLQLAGATETPTHPISSGRNDPSGIHFNIGSIPQENRKTGIRFMADYLRLVEDVYKRLTSNDPRYKYYAKRGHGFPYTSGAQSGAIVPETLSPETRATPEHEHARQFWSQSISDVRKAGTASSMSEYQFYRTRGEHYAPISSISNLSYGLEKLAKYKTVALHKLILKGIMEFRPLMYRPGGAYTLNNMAFASKMAGDLYLGSMGVGDFALTDKLVPPSRPWRPGEDAIIKKIAKHIFGIDDPVGQDFVAKLHQQCAAR